jgi:ribonuclease BN (tRNA processing enzyme)
MEYAYALYSPTSPILTPWSLVVDCAEGTIRQFALQRERGAARLKASNVKKVFITHMHGL